MAGKCEDNKSSQFDAVIMLLICGGNHPSDSLTI